MLRFGVISFERLEFSFTVTKQYNLYLVFLSVFILKAEKSNLAKKL